MYKKKMEKLLTAGENQRNCGRSYGSRRIKISLTGSEWSLIHFGIICCWYKKGKYVDFWYTECKDSKV